MTQSLFGRVLEEPTSATSGASGVAPGNLGSIGWPTTVRGVSALELSRLSLLISHDLEAVVVLSLVLRSHVLFEGNCLGFSILSAISSSLVRNV